MRHDIQPYDAWHDDTQQNVTQLNVIQHNGTSILTPCELRLSIIKLNFNTCGIMKLRMTLEMAAPCSILC